MAKNSSTAIAKPLKVYDADEDKVIEISHEMQMEAISTIQQLQAGIFIMAFGIKRMVDKKLYLALNIESKDQFLSTLEFVGRSQAYKLLAIADKFNDVFAEKLIGKNPEELQNNESVQQIGSLGISKLYELIKLDDEQLSGLSEGKDVKIGGKNMNIDELRTIGYRELEKQFRTAKIKLQEDLSIVTEENELLKEEIILKNKQIETADKKLDAAKELEIKFGGPAKTIENKDYLLKECYDLLNEFNDNIIKANIKPNDPNRLKKSVCDLIKKLDVVNKLVMETYAEITAEF